MSGKGIPSCSLLDKQGVTPADDDVLCGRGGLTNTHTGNVRFRTIVNDNQHRYLSARRADKEKIAAEVVKTVRERGGRFLGKNDAGCWEDVGDKKAVAKTCQALREGLDVRKNATNSPMKNTPEAGAAAMFSVNSHASSPMTMNVARMPAAMTHGMPPAVMVGQRVLQFDEAKDDEMDEGEPHDGVSKNDVLCGRGGRTNTHTGNVRYRRVIAQHQAQYLTARKAEKEGIARDIVKIINDRGGKFVIKNEETSEWEEIDGKKAVMKTCQALREGLDVRKKVSSSKNRRRVENTISVVASAPYLYPGATAAFAGATSPAAALAGMVGMAPVPPPGSPAAAALALAGVSPGARLGVPPPTVTTWDATLASERAPKRRKVDVSAVMTRLSVMPRKELEAISRLVLDAASDATLEAALSVMHRSQQRMTHCRRCHQWFDPVFAGEEDCVMDEHDNSQWTRIRAEDGSDKFRSGCCGKLDNAGGPCWKGLHLLGNFDGKSGYWKDTKIARAIEGWSGNTENECFGCMHGACVMCCTCGTLGKKSGK